MYFSRADSRFRWFFGSIKPFWGLTRCTWSHFSRERRSQYPFVGKPSIRRSKIDLLQIARQSLQGVPKSDINLSGGRTPHSWRETRFSIFLQKTLTIDIKGYPKFIENVQKLRSPPKKEIFQIHGNLNLEEFEMHNVF